MKIAILGASRGLGAELAAQIHLEEPSAVLFLSSRKENELKKMAGALDWVMPADFSSPDQQEQLVQRLREFLPDQVFYVAGGGPFGAYEQKAWRDHEWALQVNLLFPAKLLHTLLNEPIFKPHLKKMVFVGSAIAGHRADPKASSYAAAKHGLRGLVTSVMAEKPWLDLRLFEPGYMDTQMLPANAWPRQQGLVVSPKDEARKLWQRSQSSVE